MAFTVEDGTGLPDSNAYVSVANFTAYCASRGIDISAYSSTQIEQAITISSVDFIDVFFIFAGDTLTEGQAMQLPTDEVLIVPKLVQSVCIATVMQLSGELLLSTPSTDGTVKRIKSKVDVIEEEIEYEAGSAPYERVSTPNIDNLLDPYLESNAGSGMGEKARW